MIGVTEEQVIEWLEQKLGEYETQLTRAERERDRLRPLVASLRHVIEVEEKQQTR